MESTIDDIPSELNLHFQDDFPAMRCHSWRPDSSIPPVCSLAAGMAGNLVGPAMASALGPGWTWWCGTWSKPSTFMPSQMSNQAFAKWLGLRTGCGTVGAEASSPSMTVKVIPHSLRRWQTWWGICFFCFFLDECWHIYCRVVSIQLYDKTYNILSIECVTCLIFFEWGIGWMPPKIIID